MKSLIELKSLIERIEKAVTNGNGVRLDADEASFVLDQLTAPRMCVACTKSDQVLGGVLLGIVKRSKQSLDHSTLVRVGCLMTTRTYEILAIDDLDGEILNDFRTDLVRSGSHPHSGQSINEILTWLSLNTEQLPREARRRFVDCGVRDYFHSDSLK